MESGSPSFLYLAVRMLECLNRIRLRSITCEYGGFRPF